MTNKKIIFKFDDFSKVSKKVIKLDRYIKRKKIKITWGIIGQHFENISEKDIEWCKNALKSGYYKFWNHGYTHEFNEFKNLDLQEQINRINKTQAIIKEKLNITPDTFGEPCVAYNEFTKLALESNNDIKYWYYGDEAYKKCTLKRKFNLESPFPKPNYKLFKENYKKSNDEIIVLMGHPNLWHFWDFYNFKRIVNFLKREKAEFVFPEDIKL